MGWMACTVPEVGRGFLEIDYLDLRIFVLLGPMQLSESLPSELLLSASKAVGRGVFRSLCNVAYLF